ncbi:hypothetical protein SAMN05421869_14513 [Nonomuraea jiangxiensis]|uniref:Uncharacterized protein n=1 Tax=Nonomuraea jiangxiensis TaxID=633440 RepID=A0A1G9TLM3_9ACTN|nr:hypothetical protein SAMN05421869_14513 [Nonomuraea jiangxiensis]
MNTITRDLATGHRRWIASFGFDRGRVLLSVG